MNATGNLKKAANDLRDKARRAFYAIKRHIKLDIPIKIWLKIFDAVIEPNALYGCEVWGLGHQPRFYKMGQTSIEHQQFKLFMQYSANQY